MRSIISLVALAATAVPLAPASAQTMQGTVSGATRLFSGPLSDYPRIRTLRRGAMINVLGCLRDWSWCDVTYRGDRGWIAGNTLRIRHDGRRRGVGSGMGIGVTTFSFSTYWDSHYRGRRFYGERQRWQSQSDNAYRPEWGAREQRRDEDTDRDRGRNRDRGQGEGQHGQDLRSDNRQIEQQQYRAREGNERQDVSTIPDYTDAPYRFPDHGSAGAQPKPQMPAFPTRSNNEASGNTREPKVETARQPQN